MFNTFKNKTHEVKSRSLSGKKNFISQRTDPAKFGTLLLSALFLFCSLIKAQSWSELGGLNGLAPNGSIEH
ncbi:MAG: hypothetical protein ABIS37_15700, partial [Bacteroidia bacterium]